MGLFSFLFSKHERASEEKVPRERSEVSLHKELRPDFEECDIIPENYTVIDLETSGLDACICEILEIAAIKCRNNDVVEWYHTYVRPVGQISEDASKINHLTVEMLQNKPSLAEIRADFFNFIGNDILVGHNIGFDIKFIQTRFEIELPNKCFDTLKWSRIEFPQFARYSLDYLRRQLKLGGAAHSALGDCEATHGLLLQISQAEQLRQIMEANASPQPSAFPRGKHPPGELPYIADEDFSAGCNYWNKGEEKRINGDFDGAFRLYEKAREVGYDYPWVYVSYAKAYRKLKDYDKEIQILDAALQKYGDTSYADELNYRKTRTLSIVQNQIEKKQQIQQKAALKAEKEERKKNISKLKDTPAKKHHGRSVIQLNDAGELINTFETITDAANACGISTKVIRDAANGRQKHAGGFCWRYAEEEEAGTVTAEIPVSDLDTNK